MRVVALNGSFRKNGNSATMLEAFLDGIRETYPNAEVERVDVYDLDYKGCRGCQGCQLKATEDGYCIVKDGAYQILRDIKDCDLLVIASPIYYFDVSSQLRALFERVFYPGHADHTIPVVCIYTMNQPEDVMRKRFRGHLDVFKMFLDSTFATDTKELYSFETLHFGNPEKYNFPEGLYEKRLKIHNEQFPKDLAMAKEAGKQMVLS